MGWFVKSTIFKSLLGTLILIILFWAFPGLYKAINTAFPAEILSATPVCFAV